MGCCTSCHLWLPPPGVCRLNGILHELYSFHPKLVVSTLSSYACI
jgi:hypothetical protein